MILFVMLRLLAANTIHVAAEVQAQYRVGEIISGEIDKSDFPEVSLDFSIRNALPNQLEPLKIDQVTILEGNEFMPITRLEK